MQSHPNGGLTKFTAILTSANPSRSEKQKISTLLKVTSFGNPDKAGYAFLCLKAKNERAKITIDVKTRFFNPNFPGMPQKSGIRIIWLKNKTARAKRRYLRSSSALKRLASR